MTVSFVTLSIYFFFNDTATTEIYTLSLHDALPILFKMTANGVLTSLVSFNGANGANPQAELILDRDGNFYGDRKSTRLNSSHSQISYAVFCLKKKKNKHLQLCTTRTIVSHTLRNCL